MKYGYHPELGGAVTASFLAEREPTEAERKEADAFMLAVVANSPACAGVVYRSIRPAAGEGK